MGLFSWGGDKQTTSSTTSNTDASWHDSSLNAGDNSLIAGQGAKISVINNDVSGDLLTSLAKTIGDASSRAIDSNLNVAYGAEGLANGAIGTSAALANMITARADDTTRRALSSVDDATALANRTASDSLTRMVESQTASLKFAGDVSRDLRDVSLESVTSMGRLSSDALSRQVEANANALSFGNYVAGRSADLSAQAIVGANRSTDAIAKTASDLSSNQTSLLAQLISSNANQTEAARQGNNVLATSFVDKAITGISDSRANANETILTNAFKYGSYAAVAVAVAFGLYALSKKKAA